jgi:hypothetical protein
LPSALTTAVSTKREPLWLVAEKPTSYPPRSYEARASSAATTRSGPAPVEMVRE